MEGFDDQDAAGFRIGSKYCSISWWGFATAACIECLMVIAACAHNGRLVICSWLIGDTFGCLTAFLRLGMFLQESTHETGCHGLVTMAMMVARRSGDIASTHRMLSRKKGRQYGEGHQKALQISVRWLSLGGVLVDGRERESC